ncbi:MAG: hypothetical protein PHR68_01990 [Candidatus Gracilibacteria bacterium]|nr:hypothetical protein [Candidatus Gracilibacteria bacterium]
MNKIIGGKLYDTEKADLLISAGNGLSGSDFRYFSEDLYITKKGNFFIHGEGGPLTKYVVESGSRRNGSEDIFVLDKKDVLNWLEENSKYISKSELKEILPLIKNKIEIEEA